MPDHEGHSWPHNATSGTRCPACRAPANVGAFWNDSHDTRRSSIASERAAHHRLLRELADLRARMEAARRLLDGSSQP